MRKIILLFFVITIALFNNEIGSAEGPKNYLKGKFYSSVKDHFLIATEKMRDNRFNETVIVMLESDKNGAWGLVINKRIGTMPIALIIDPSLNTKEEREKLYKIKNFKWASIGRQEAWDKDIPFIPKLLIAEVL